MKRGFVAGVISSVWSAVLGLAVVPVYLRHLGVEAYALIGLLATVQAIATLLDLGWAGAINREVALRTAEGQMRPARELFRTLSPVYWATALAIAASAIFVAPMLLSVWSPLNNLPAKTVHDSVILIGCVIACRWPITLYQSALVGAQRVAWTSVASMIMSTVANLGAVLVLTFLTPRIEVFLLWQAFVGLIYAIFMRSAARNAVGVDSDVQYSFAALRRVWPFSSGMAVVAASALLLQQTDKIVLLGFLSLAEFGRYSLATVVAGSIYLIAWPVFNVAFPRFTALVAIADTAEIVKLYRLGTRLTAIALSSIAVFLIVFGQDMVAVWTGDYGLAHNVSRTVGILALAAALHGVSLLPFAIQVAFGATRLPVMTNLALCILAWPLITWLAINHGKEGGALGLLVVEVANVLFSGWLTRKLLPGVWLGWAIHDVFVPFLISCLLGLAALWILHDSNLHTVTSAAAGVLLLSTTWAVSMVAAPRSTTAAVVAILGMASAPKRVGP